jgi:signal peptidase I
MTHHAAARLDRRVRREVKALVRETRRALRRYSYKLGEAVRGDITHNADTLDKAYQANDGDAMRIGLVKLDELADEHLGFARKSTVREYAESIGIAVLIALFLRAFVVEAFKIPSGSMIPTMEIGDHIFVNKFIYGIRIPWTRIKLFEFRKPKRGEVIVFINPCEPDKDFIKRIVALENDTVEVRCDLLYVNGEMVESRMVSELDCGYWDFDEEMLKDWQQEECSRYVEVTDGVSYETMHLPTRPSNDRERKATPEGSYSRFAGNRDFPTTRVPECNLPDRHRSAEQKRQSHGRIEPSFPEDQRYAGPCQPQRRYIVPRGHVFVMGDNRENSSDSRAWGAVPLENIKGKALFIWWSSKPEHAGGVQWNRIGKVVY